MIPGLEKALREIGEKHEDEETNSGTKHLPEEAGVEGVDPLWETFWESFSEGGWE